MSQLDSERINLIRKVYQEEGSIAKTAKITGHCTGTINKYVAEVSSQKSNSRYCIRPVLKVHMTTRRVIDKYKSLSDAAKLNGLSISSVCHAIRRIGTAGGYLWEYED